MYKITFLSKKMSETETIIPATSSGGPSVAAVSMSPTPLDVSVKIERLEPDHNEVTEPKPIIVTEVRTCTGSTAGQSQLQIMLTRLPTYLLNRYIENANVNKVCSDEKSALDLGLHTELDIKFEPEEELKEEPQDYDDAVDDNGALPTDELKLNTNGTSETHQTVEHITADIDLLKPYEDENTAASNYIPRKDKKTNTKYQTKEVSYSNTDVFLKIPHDCLYDKFNSSQANKAQCINNDSGIQSAKEYSCATCKYTTNITYLLKSHLQGHSAARNYISDTCYIAKVKKKKIDHVRIHKGENPFACDTCHKKFGLKSDLYNHMRMHTSKKPYVCKICDKKFTKNSSLQNHMRIHTRERFYVCKICDKMYTQNSNLKRHMRIHTGEKLYVCKICDKMFTSSSDLQNHTRIHTGERPYVCKICDKKYTQNSTLKRHMRIHTGEKPYVCKICDKMFTRSTDLQNHTRKHTGERPYVCKICNKKFTYSTSLHDHMRIHTGKRFYVCKICYKKCTQNGNLKRHMRIHTGEKPYVCKICNKKFTQKSNLKRHMIIHRGERPYVCKICDKQFTESGGLHKHMKVHTE